MMDEHRAEISHPHRAARLALGATPGAVALGFVALGSGLGAALFLGMLGTIAVGSFRAVVTGSVL